MIWGFGYVLMLPSLNLSHKRANVHIFSYCGLWEHFDIFSIQKMDIKHVKLELEIETFKIID